MKVTKATNPNQYDTPELDWSIIGAENKPTRIFFREELERAVTPNFLQDKRVLDIGSGVGQLFNWLKMHGATEVVGIDPSIRNIKVSGENYPWAISIKSTLQEFALSNREKFDVAFALLVFEHIQDLDSAFRDISSLLINNGELYLIITDKDYNVINDKEIRGKTFVSAEIINEFENGSVETKTIRDSEKDGQIVMFDIFHPIDNVLQSARENGFKLLKNKPVLGPYTIPQDKRVSLICHLLVFRKK
jgi:2-polyprenyl-3-methyl-5-hydroxy-6-metoxy-1,4-benzoquinol methylase